MQKTYKNSFMFGLQARLYLYKKSYNWQTLIKL